MPNPSLHPLPPTHRRRAGGWSLLEATVTVLILAVLLRLAIPGWTALVDATRLSATSNAFLGSLGLARAEALRRVDLVAVCKSRDGATCAATGGWEQGWLTFHDGNANGQPDPSEAVIEHAAGAVGMVLAGNQAVASIITFGPSGRTRTPGGGMQAGTLTLCATHNPTAARQIVINNTGRVRVRRSGPSACPS